MRKDTVMRQGVLILGCVFVLFVSCGFAGNPEQRAQNLPDASVRQLTVTGEIAHMSQGYIIRGKAPAEIFTILNPNPDLLDKLITKGKEVEALVRIVSGDNVEIEKIDGKDYLK